MAYGNIGVVTKLLRVACPWLLKYLIKLQIVLCLGYGNAWKYVRLLLFQPVVLRCSECAYICNLMMNQGFASTLKQINTEACSSELLFTLVLNLAILLVGNSEESGWFYTSLARFPKLNIGTSSVH